MKPRITDVHVAATQRLISPRALKEELPLTEQMERWIAASRGTICRIISGEDRRQMVIVGPCSIHDPDAAVDYAQRLAKLAPQVAERIHVVMRVYFEKPRTTTGWKGLINDPRMDDSCDMELGLRIARRLLIEINSMGLPAATELLDPITPQYIGDLISWTAVGARTTESQTHREMASGLSMPVGFKNRTDGDLRIAVNAIESARGAHSFIGIDQEGLTAIIRTTGNSLTHVVLRGGEAPNYDAASIAQCERMLTSAGLPARVMVDCSHAQTNKDYTRQPAVLRALIDQIAAGNRSIMGVMLESNIEAGNQKPGADRSALKYGVSITDPCIDWATTQRCILEAAELLAKRDRN
jgi:3-deoxy-7-phosphoheptulonate synthase